MLLSLSLMMHLHCAASYELHKDKSVVKRSMSDEMSGPLTVWRDIDTAPPVLVGDREIEREKWDRFSLPEAAKAADQRTQAAANGR